jgi:hypothetical protein
MNALSQLRHVRHHHLPHFLPGVDPHKQYICRSIGKTLTGVREKQMIFPQIHIRISISSNTDEAERSKETVV